jgi:phosphoribosylformimino-5-aminoimidazole carboxamide ribotide isomerase
VKVIPAIDLMNGKVVRLSRGDPNTAKVYDQWGTPVQVALRWKGQGATKLHIIDLDAALGRGDNMSIISKIAKASGLPIQVGGGVRTLNKVEKLVKFGANHVILGSLAFSNSETLTQLQKMFGFDPLIVALDNKNGNVMVEGWKTPTAFTISNALAKFTALGVKCFLITSIAKDGMLSGPDIETLGEACRYPGIEVIAAGGIGTIADLVALKRVGVQGVVVGKALYEARFTLKEAISSVEAD